MALLPEVNCGSHLKFIDYSLHDESSRVFLACLLELEAMYL